MATLPELKKAFSSYRKRSGLRRDQIKYPAQLKLAIQDFARRNPEVARQEIAEAVDVTPYTIGRWIDSGGSSEFVPVKVIDDRKHPPGSPTRISSGNVSVHLSEAATAEEVERVIKLLTAG